MDPQLIFVDQATGRVQRGNADEAAPFLLALQGTTLALRVGFIAGAIPGELPEGTTGRLVGKKKLDHTGDPVLLVTAWTLDGEGTAARYEFEMIVDGTGLRTLLSGKAAVELGMQIEWQVPGEDAPRKSEPFALHVLSSYAQEEDGVPDPGAAAAWEWLKARLVGGTNITLTTNNDGKTITISAAGEIGGSVAWGDVTGKPGSFTPSSHSHTSADLPMASQAEAEAGVSSTKVMSPLRVAQAIDALAGTGGGGVTITHRFRAYVDNATGSDVTGMMGREDKPFATMAGAVAAWEAHESYDVEGLVTLVLGPGEHSLNQERTTPLRLRVLGQGVGQTTCSIVLNGAAGAAGVYGEPTGQAGGAVELYLESDHSVFFQVTLGGGDGGAAYYIAETPTSPGLGGEPTLVVSYATLNGVELVVGARGELGSGTPPAAEERACYALLVGCQVLGAFAAEVPGDQKWATEGNELQLRHSRIEALTISGTIESGPVGFARVCDIGTGPAEDISYIACAGPEA